MTLAKAQEQSGGLIIQIKEVESDSEAGTVIDQDIASGSQVEEGTTITLTVSKGPAQPVEKTITKSIALPEGEGTVKVRVVVGGSDVQFDSDVDRALMEISIPLKMCIRDRLWAALHRRRSVILLVRLLPQSLR